MLNITFRNLDSSVTIQSLADTLMTKLVRGEPARCHLVVEDKVGAHAHCEDRFAVHLDLSLAHADMSFQSHCAHADATVAVREAFDRVERQMVRQVGRRAAHKRS
ncbi:MAG TPA: HPF/RaiA family ribosome-associated protein [Polyangiales bacterium]